METTTASAASPSVAELDLELDVFAGPFDLLLAIVLREEVSLADVALGEIVVAYVEHLDQAGELDLEPVTEFLVLIAALLEIKSRQLLPAPEDDGDGLELGPEEAADELVARMLEYRRYRDAAERLKVMHAEGSRYGHREAPLPAALRRVAVDAAVACYEPATMPRAIGELLKSPPEPDTSHIRPTVSLERRLGILQSLLTGGSIDFDQHFGGEDRLTQAVTIFALLELYKRGEAVWEQEEIFGPIRVVAADG